ncbi:MAG: flagellar basal body M-ring protein FliF, partial [Paraglaciecola sp.]|nr:flagellar basal body M-ring protein FliF [Paraglaciecola sp.]
MAEATGTELAMNNNMGMDSYGNDQIVEQKSGFMDSLGGTDLMRQVVLIIALVICCTIAIVVFLWANQPDYRPLAAMQTQELVETLDYFDQNQIDYRLEGNTILVNSEQYQSIKLGMTRQGLTQSDTQGTDIIMQDMGFGVSQRVEKERLKHSRELQIANTIEEMSGIT